LSTRLNAEYFPLVPLKSMSALRRGHIHLADLDTTQIGGVWNFPDRRDMLDPSPKVVSAPRL
jgi:hypothetical protein